jgi:hypothetical protein
LRERGTTHAERERIASTSAKSESGKRSIDYKRRKSLESSRSTLNSDRKMTAQPGNQIE